jgi:hypothetical protein
VTSAFGPPERNIIGTCLLVMLISFALQMIPLVNFFALLVGAPYWFGIALHVMLITIGAQAWRGRLPLIMIGLPIIYYGAGFGFHLASSSRALAIAAQIEAANDAVTFVAPKPFFYRADDRAAVGDVELLERFRVERAYLIGKDSATIRSFAKGAGCNATNGFYYDRRFDEPYLYRRDLFYFYKGADKTRQCVLSIDGMAPPYRYRIVNEQSPSRGDWLNPRFGERFSVIDDQERKTVAVVETASLKRLPPILTLLGGCSLRLSTGGAPEKCGIFPVYSSKIVPAAYRPRNDDGNPFTPTLDPMQSRVGALGKAIGLEPRTPRD